NLAYVEELLDNPKMAIIYLEKALLLDSHAYNAQYNIGILYIKSNQPEKALDHLKTAITIRDTPEARHNYFLAKDQIKIQSKQAQ
ncbi:MAG: tetratricopeptide repeat protein, partial [Chlamydiota bacterium]|nr:tetratricopeptide repeat protein [Chlamydiota bacterium]